MARGHAWAGGREERRSDEFRVRWAAQRTRPQPNAER